MSAFLHSLYSISLIYNTFCGKLNIKSNLFNLMYSILIYYYYLNSDIIYPQSYLFSYLKTYHNQISYYYYSQFSLFSSICICLYFLISNHQKYSIKNYPQINSIPLCIYHDYHLLFSYYPIDNKLISHNFYDQLKFLLLYKFRHPIFLLYCPYHH
jgi:hypothetical protein